jgi:hypothetical protein
MDIRLTDTGTLELLEPDNFTAFKLTKLAAAQSTVAEASSGIKLLEAAGLRPDGEHVWMPSALIRKLAGEHVTEEWESNFAGMVRYAASKGWYDADGDAIRAHLETVG